MKKKVKNILAEDIIGKPVRKWVENL